MGAEQPPIVEDEPPIAAITRALRDPGNPAARHIRAWLDQRGAVTPWGGR